MLTDAIKTLIFEEQARQAGRFVAAADLDAYLDKLGAHAEILADTQGNACRGFVAFYCNDVTTRRAYISLVMVAPSHRGSGLGRALITGVLEICRQRGFTACGLEVRSDNVAARRMYAALRFAPVGERAGTLVLECAL